MKASFESLHQRARALVIALRQCPDDAAEEIVILRELTEVHAQAKLEAIDQVEIAFLHKEHH